MFVLCELRWILIARWTRCYQRGLLLSSVADSCQTDGFGKQTGSSCKIVSLGNFACVANSFIYHDEPRFDLAAIFKRIGAVESLSELVAT